MYDGGEHTPKLLPCSHTVCLQCLIRIVATFARDTGQFRCPICRELITIPRGGVQALPPSFLVNQLLDLMARQRREVIPKCSQHQNQVGNQDFCIFLHFLLLFSLGVVVLWDLRLCFLYPVYRGWSHYHHCQHWGPHCHTVLNSNQEDVRNTHLQGQWMHGKSRFEIVISESQN